MLGLSIRLLITSLRPTKLDCHEHLSLSASLTRQAHRSRKNLIQSRLSKSWIGGLQRLGVRNSAASINDRVDYDHGYRGGVGRYLSAFVCHPRSNGGIENECPATRDHLRRWFSKRSNNRRAGVLNIQLRL